MAEGPQTTSMIDTTDGASKSTTSSSMPISAAPMQGRSYQMDARPATGSKKIVIKAKQVKLTSLSSKEETQSFTSVPTVKLSAAS